MKQKLLAIAIAAAASLMAPLSANAGVVGIADMNVTALGFTTPPGGLTLLIENESRTGTASANYNGVSAVYSGAGGTGPGASITGFGAAVVDVGYRCAGQCATAAGLYNGSLGGLENATNHIGTPGAANYALGDMFISGSALGGSISGQTRANAVSTGPTNSGGANATILNSGVVSGSFTVGTTFTSSLTMGVDAYLQAWVDPFSLGVSRTASAAYGWNILITDAIGNEVLKWTPAELNKGFGSSDSAGNALKTYSYAGALSSATATFVKGVKYDFTINQSSNATVRDVPEPASIALIGIALLGAGAVTRRRMK
ncbi:MAG: PEP-CTERM sorting domain-containing protein [Burkholderiaceae bacterium]|nr:PEP-CTERM sorting domain-containing protein [Burkholderiaceae bacterium]